MSRYIAHSLIKCESSLHNCPSSESKPNNFIYSTIESHFDTVVSTDYCAVRLAHNSVLKTFDRNNSPHISISSHTHLSHTHWSKPQNSILSATENHFDADASAGFCHAFLLLFLKFAIFHNLSQLSIHSFISVIAALIIHSIYRPTLEWVRMNSCFKSAFVTS